jgi:formate dehydrogenase iron-sulfur subunit
MCIDRVDNGLKPACATACPTGAVQFGTRDDMLRIAKKRQAILEKQTGAPVRIYGETELGGLGVMTILTDKASVYGLPEQPKKPLLLPRWLIGIVPGAVILYGMFKNLVGARVKAEKEEKVREEQA